MPKTPRADKPYFRIGDVAEMLGVEPYVLRFWEREFPQIRPVRAPSRHRIYRREDLKLIAYIKRLLHEEGYTIAGARRRLEELAAAQAPPPQETPDREILEELRSILKLLD